MGKLDDLHTLVKLLDAFELPVSPILEYAIKEKEEELIQAGYTEEFDSSASSDIQEYQEVDRNAYQSDFIHSRTRSNTETLRVEFPDGRVIQYPRASDTYIEVIKTSYPDLIHELNIVHAGINIVSKEYDDKYAKAQHEIEGGWLVFTNTPTRKKKEDLIRISEELGLGLKVEVVLKGTNESVEDFITDSTRQKLRVTFPNGKVIQPNKVYEAVVEVVRYAGAENVKDLNIIVCGDNLVLKQPRARYVKACKPIGNGWLVNTCSSTPIKYAQIKHISSMLNLGITVEILGGEDAWNNGSNISSIVPNTNMMGGQRNVNQDRTMFSLNGSEYMSKVKFVRAVVREYIKKYPKATYDELAQTFCSELLEAGYRFKGLLCPIEEWNSWENEYKTRRYYVAGDDSIFQSSDGCQFYVNTQWTLESVNNVIQIAEREGFLVSRK